MIKSKERIGLISIFALVLALLFGALFVNSANEEISSDVDGVNYLAAGDKVTIMDNGVSDFEHLVYGTLPFSGEKSEAMKLESWFYKFSKDLYAYPEKSTTPTTNVVTFGRVTNVPLSVRLADDIDARPETSYVWGIAYENGVLAIYVNSKSAIRCPYKSLTESGHEIFKDMDAALEELVSDGKIIVTEGMYIVQEITAEEYEQMIKDDEKQAAEEQVLLREERKEKLPALIAAIGNSAFNPSGKGYTSDLYSLTSTRYPAPDKYPTKDAHPRVYFTADMIPGILEAMKDPENAVAVEKFWEAAEKWITGELGPRKVTSSTSHNHSGATLDIIQAKAFAYVLTGDTYYGYGAIYAMQNYLRTLDYDGRSSDQCRDFGQIMYITACVYDWCHDLLTEDDVFRFVSGVEQLIVTGDVKNEDGKIMISSSTVKMEVGFPPTGQGSATGHGSEDQILRDYLSFAIAIFDEVPGWYELIGGRFYSQYVNIRNAYYSAGLVPQGTGGYNSGRYTSDLHSAVLMLAATGENPYNDAYMREVAYGLLVPLTNPDAKDHNVFYIGDCRPHQTPRLQIGYSVTIMSSYLFDDPLMRGVAKWVNSGFSSFSSGESGVSPCEFLIYSSRGTKTVEDPFKELPLVTYNGGWYGQIISRNKWGDGAAVSLMKVQEKTTANHDHAAAGTFQIYYKGILTGDMGDYTGVAYGSDHCVYFMRATVAHNGLLIYNPTLKNSNKGYYSGGQRQGIGEPSHTSWFSNASYTTGKVTGYRYAYDFDNNATFAYLAGDITAAYDSITVDYVGRTMLTVYTEDETMPMIFFVFDNISADDPTFKKTFLLQVPGEEAPVVDYENKTVTVTNGEGKLVLHNLIGGENITEWGGNDPTKEEPNNRLNYVVNGEQLHYYGSSYNNGPSGYVASDGESWGRVELSPDTGNKTDVMFNVMLIADDGRKMTEKIETFKAYGIEKGGVLMEGATVAGATALFVSGEKNVSESIKFTAPGEGLTTYYIGGIYKGTWRVVADGEYLGSVYSTNDSNMVTFKAPAGVEIQLLPGDDIRPANSGEISFALDGGSWVKNKAPFEFYPLGKTTALPDASLLTKQGAVFEGWYSDAECTNKITEIPADAGDKFVAYAKWTVDPLITNTDYSKTTSKGSNLEFSPQAGLGSASAEDKAVAKIVYNSDGYYLWTSKAGGPTVYGRTTYKNYESTVFSFAFTISKNGSDPVLVTGLRMRAPNKDNKDVDVSLFSTDEAGVVKSGDGVTLATLTDSPTTIRFTVDFAKGKIYYFANEYGEVLYERKFTPPSSTVAKDTLELLNMMKENEIFSWRANGNKTGVGALRIHAIQLEAQELFRNDVGNNIVYNTNGGEFTDGTQLLTPYDKDNSSLSTNIVRDGYIFDGWYSDSGLTTKIDAVPAGKTGAFPVFAKWVRHKIIYNTNGGQFAASPETSYTPGEAKTLASDITLAGHTFLGWYTTPDFQDGTLVTEVPATAYDEYKVYAKWVKNSIVYNTNGGEFDKDPVDTYVPGVSTELPTDITNGEFIFAGWYTEPSFSESSLVSAVPADAIGEFVVYAKWTLEGDKIYYVTNDGSFNGTPNTDYTENRALSTDIERDGYSFLGWYIDPAFTTPAYAVPGGYKGTFIVYAKWFKTVVLHDDMSQAAEKSFNYVECDSHADADNDGKCDSCKVCMDIKTCHSAGKGSSCPTCGREWKTERPSNKISSASGNMDMKDYAAVKYSKVDMDGDEALLIDVQHKTDDGLFYIGRNVTTDAYKYFSDASGNVIPTEIVFSIDVARLADKTTPTFEIRFFKERNCFFYLYDGKVYNKREATDSALIAELTEELQTIEITFNIEKLAQGEVTYSVYSPAQGKILTRRISGTNATDVLFQWRYNSSTNAAFIIDDIKVTVPNAEWGSSVVYNTNGGEFASAPDTTYKPGEVKTLATNLTKPGYSFAGWYTSSSYEEGTLVTEVPASAEGAFEVYARWEENKVVYDTNGGEFVTAPTEKYTPGESFTLPTDITNGIYTFEGWYTTETFDEGTKVEALPTDASGTVTLYAKWSLNANIVIYETNGGEFITAPNTDYTVAGRNLPTNVVKQGYTFLGWYTEPELKNKVNAVPEDFEGGFSVYAAWIKTVIVNEDMSGLTVGSANWVECANHADTNADGACDSCKYCMDTDACRGTAASPKASVCSVCQRSWATERVTVKGFKDSNDMSISKYPAAKVSTVTLNGSDALRIDIQKHYDDGLFYIGAKRSTNIVKLLQSEGGAIIAPMLEFSMDLANVSGKATVPFGIRAFKSRANVLVVNKNGNVYLGSENEAYLITTLTEASQNIKLTINTQDVASGKLVISAYSTAQGKAISRTVTGTLGAEDTLLQLRFSGVKDAAIIMDNVKITVPNSTNMIEYPEGVTLPSGAPMLYEEGGNTALPESATKSGYKFLGWYDNSACEGEPITSVPSTATGAFRVYAKWQKMALVDSKVEYVDDTQVVYSTSEPCFDGNSDGKCDECGACMHFEFDNNKKCTACGLSVELCKTHADTNSDSKCDTCGYYVKQSNVHTYKGTSIGNGMVNSTGENCYAEFRVVDNGDDDYVRVLMMNNAGGGPSYNPGNDYTTSIADYLSDSQDKILTVSVNYGRDTATDSVVPLHLRMRDSSNNVKINLLYTNSEGTIMMGDNSTVIGALPESGMVNISIVMDMANGKHHYFLDGEYKGTYSKGVDYTQLTGVAGNIMQTRFNGAENHASIRIGDYLITEGALYTVPEN